MKKTMRYGWYVLSLVLVIGMIIPAGALAQKTVKIGAIYPLTGGAAAAGRELRAGVELAVELANNAMADINMTMAKSAGITSLDGAKIEIIFKDHEGNPTLGADLAKKLILDDKVDGLMGCYHSSVTKTVSAVAEQQGVPGYLLDSPDQIQEAWLKGKHTVAVTAGASAPEVLVQQVIARLKETGADAVLEQTGRVENVTFALPRELRRRV